MTDWLMSAAAWWGGTALGGGAILLAGCGLMRCTRDPASRQRVGEIAVVAALLVAVLRCGPVWLNLPWPGSSAIAAEPSPSTLASELSGWIVLTPTTESLSETPPSVETAVALPTPSWHWSWETTTVVVTGAYLAIAFLLLARWVLGQWALVQLRRRSRPASARARSLFAKMAGAALWPRPRLGRTNRLRLPVAFGLRQPAVLLPDQFDEQADDTTLRWVFAHELTHLRRRDPWSYWAVGLAQAVYFYLPWFWWLKRQVRLCQEYIADAAAAREGAAADDYAEFLVNLAKGPVAPLGAAGLGASSDLFRRVHMLLQPSSRDSNSGSRSSARLAGLGLLTAAVLASGVGVRADDPKPDPVKPILDDVIIQLEALPTIDLQDLVIRLDDDAKDKDKEKKDKEKSDKKRVIVIQQDGKNIITIPADANIEDVKKQVEKAMTEAKKQSEKAKKAAEEARGEARKAAEQERTEARKAAEEARGEARKEVERARKRADEARKQGDEARNQRDEARKQGEAVAKERIEMLQGGRMIRRGDGRLGISVDGPSATLADQLNLEKGNGLVIVSVVEDSPAAKAGFKTNDILVEFAGKPVSSDGGEFSKMIRELKSDEPVSATVLRKGHKERIRGIKLGEAKASESKILRLSPDGALKLDGEQRKKLELKLEGMPKMDGKEFKFDFNFDGIPGVDGKKLSDQIKREIELKMVPLQKQLDPGKIEELQKKIELKIAPLRDKIDAEKLGEIKKEIELKMVPLKEKLGDLQKQIEVIVVPEGAKIDGRQGKFTIITPEANPEGQPKRARVIVDGEKKSSDKPGKTEKSEMAEKSSNMSVSVTVNNGEFKAVQKEDKLEITVLGDASGEKVKVREVRIYGDGEKNVYRSVDDVPSKYRDKVKKLIANKDGSPVRFRFDRDDGN
jgi:beta-lactamase regulating signal transducer with metallopeptidase domain